MTLVARNLRNVFAATTVFTLSLSLNIDAAAFSWGGWPVNFASAAWADDDDDGGDDDGGGGSRGASSRGSGGMGNFGGGGRKFFRPARRNVNKRAPRRAAAPAPALREIVGLDISGDQIAQLQQAGFVVLERDDLDAFGGNITRLQVPRRLTLVQARAEIVAQAPQAVVDDNHLYRPQQSLSDECLTRDCLARNLIAWQFRANSPSACIANVRLGMIDTGINRDHAALKDARLEVMRMRDADRGDSGLQHGTAVAALFVGAVDSRSPGLLPGAALIAVDAFSRKGGGELSDAYTLVRGIDYLVGRQVDVINLSLSGPQNAVVERGVVEATDANVLLVAASGNEGPRAKPVYPAAYQSVLAVTAVDRSKRPYRRAGRGEHVDIAAPGVDVWTAASVSGATLKTGTSFAAPFVSAAAAAWLANAPNAKASDAVEALTSNAEDLGDPGKDHVFGWGLIRPKEICAPEVAN